RALEEERDAAGRRRKGREELADRRRAALERGLVHRAALDVRPALQEREARFLRELRRRREREEAPVRLAVVARALRALQDADPEDAGPRRACLERLGAAALRRGLAGASERLPGLRARRVAARRFAGDGRR